MIEGKGKEGREERESDSKTERERKREVGGWRERERNERRASTSYLGMSASLPPSLSKYRLSFSPRRKAIKLLFIPTQQSSFLLDPDVPLPDKVRIVVTKYGGKVSALPRIPRGPNQAKSSNALSSLSIGRTRTEHCAWNWTLFLYGMGQRRKQ